MYTQLTKGSSAIDNVLCCVQVQIHVNINSRTIPTKPVDNDNVKNVEAGTFGSAFHSQTTDSSITVASKVGTHALLTGVYLIGGVVR